MSQSSALNLSAINLSANTFFSINLFVQSTDRHGRWKEKRTDRIRTPTQASVPQCQDEIIVRHRQMVRFPQRLSTGQVACGIQHRIVGEPCSHATANDSQRSAKRCDSQNFDGLRQRWSANDAAGLNGLVCHMRYGSRESEKQHAPGLGSLTTLSPCVYQCRENIKKPSALDSSTIWDWGLSF